MGESQPGLHTSADHLSTQPPDKLLLQILTAFQSTYTQTRLCSWFKASVKVMKNSWFMPASVVAYQSVIPEVVISCCFFFFGFLSKHNPFIKKECLYLPLLIQISGFFFCYLWYECFVYGLCGGNNLCYILQLLTLSFILCHCGLWLKLKQEMWCRC